MKKLKLDVFCCKWRNIVSEQLSDLLESELKISEIIKDDANAKFDDTKMDSVYIDEVAINTNGNELSIATATVAHTDIKTLSS